MYWQNTKVLLYFTCAKKNKNIPWLEAKQMGPFSRKPDRYDKNDSDGQSFCGFDNDDGTTDWYTSDGTLDSTSKTPRDDD